MGIPSNRAAAKAQGAPHYFTGLPCKHGHVALRETKGCCVECRRLETLANAAARRVYFEAYGKSDAGRAAKQAYYARNKEQVIARALARPDEDKNRYRKKWKVENPTLVTADARNRRHKHRYATPAWLTQDQRNAMRDLYLMAMRMTKTTGVPYVVDHIVPLRSPMVCGLHVPWNLQVLTREANLRKSNKCENHSTP